MDPVPGSIPEILDPIPTETGTRFGSGSKFLDPVPMETGTDSIKWMGNLILLNRNGACENKDEFGDVAEEMELIYGYIFCYADGLRAKQDGDGNTPLHLAIKGCNFSATKFLMQRCLQSEQRQELNINNSEDDSIFDLFASKAHSPGMCALMGIMIQAKRLVKERAFVDMKMDDNLYKAAVTMDMGIFNSVRGKVGNVECGSSINSKLAYLLARTPDGSNIIHIVLRQGEENGANFIKEALDRYPSFLVQADSNGDTPLHLAAKLANPLSEYLMLYIQEKNETLIQRGYCPWEAKNSAGNTPIHEALRASNGFAARKLLELDADQGAFHVNGLGETPLHVYARLGLDAIEKLGASSIFENLVNSNSSAAYARDNEGRTPLLRAAKCGHVRFVMTILRHCPQSAWIRDPNGRTFLHLMHYTSSDINGCLSDKSFNRLGKGLFEIPEADAQRSTKNSVGAEILTRRCLQTKSQQELKLVNNQDETVLTLLESHALPNEIVDLIRKKHPKTSYGVPEAEVKDSAGSLSVIAVLLATITFTAALQVPGGFDDKGGFPVLLKETAFHVFLVMNAFTMCASIVVLFSLLWVMGSSKKIVSFLLLDISLFLLQASFYATLVALMAGIYVTASSKSLWLAVFICILCSMVILVTRKGSILILSRRIRPWFDTRRCSFRICMSSAS
ncbi:hypothetical protein Cgig2_029662 [Carnegiea gigantea]|uniref:PGG domain-containing protein n=1 Tax=Carnegiea gigantea TaxID=171969 RepID=A0A9Q1QIS6_9CARY|nr:hypothetical protein Cgig2_029662 [Carnegiea gigantea]